MAKINNAANVLKNRGEDVVALERLLDLLKPPKPKCADQRFLVQVLHLVNPSDEIFARDYLYVRPQKTDPLADLPLIDNYDGFYDNLPSLFRKGKRSTHQLRLTKKQKAAMKIYVYELR